MFSFYTGNDHAQYKLKLVAPNNICPAAERPAKATANSRRHRCTARHALPNSVYSLDVPVSMIRLLLYLLQARPTCSASYHRHESAAALQLQPQKMDGKRWVDQSSVKHAFFLASCMALADEQKKANFRSILDCLGCACCSASGYNGLQNVQLASVQLQRLLRPQSSVCRTGAPHLAAQRGSVHVSVRTSRFTPLAAVAGGRFPLLCSPP
jgi:hypothetical protein